MPGNVIRMIPDPDRADFKAIRIYLFTGDVRTGTIGSERLIDQVLKKKHGIPS